MKWAIDWGAKVIITKRLELVPVHIKYSEELFELWSDVDVIKYTNSNLVKTQEECDERLKVFIDHTNYDTPNNFIILLDNKSIGIIGFLSISNEKQEWGFYYQLIKKYWGNGYANEAAFYIVKYIFQKYPESTLYADCVVNNFASISILKNLDFYQTHIEENKFNNLDVAHFKLSKK